MGFEAWNPDDPLLTWRIEVTDLAGVGEVADKQRQVLFIEPVPTAKHAIAHALAHLECGHHQRPGGRFTEAECDEADELAADLLTVEAFV